MDEYIGYIQQVLEGLYKDFEIMLNATSVITKKDVTIAEHHYRIDAPFENENETEEFIELLLIWKEGIL